MLDEQATAYSDNLLRFASVVKQMPALTAPHVLDLGCGTARCALALRERWPDANMVGLDRDRAALKNSLSLIRPIQADLRALPLGIGQFGLIVIRHPNVDRVPKGWQAAIRAVPRLLHSDGILLVTCYSLTELDQIQHWLVDAETKSASAVQPIMFTYKLLAAPDAVGHDHYPAAWRCAGEI